MAASCCFTLPRISSSSQLNYPRLASTISHDFPAAQHSVRTTNHTRGNLRNGCSFFGGRRIFVHRRSLGVSASLLSASQIASSAFTWGTVAVLPFYTFMVVAPKSHLTKKMMASGTPFIALGLLYGYLLYLSWTPDTIHLMFASKYWLPELPGIAKMFANDMTLASAWIHLLAVDLYAAKQVYEDGMHNDVETRHSVSLCLLFCPIGILVHIITKALAGRDEKHTIQ